MPHYACTPAIGLAIVDWRPLPPGSEFGWSLDPGDDSQGLVPLADLLTQSGIRWVKFPFVCSPRQDDEARENAPPQPGVVRSGRTTYQLQRPADSPRNADCGSTASTLEIPTGQVLLSWRPRRLPSTPTFGTPLVRAYPGSLGELKSAAGKSATIAIRAGSAVASCRRSFRESRPRCWTGSGRTWMSESDGPWRRRCR